MTDKTEEDNEETSFRELVEEIRKLRRQEGNNGDMVDLSLLAMEHKFNSMSATAYGSCEECLVRYKFEMEIKNSGEAVGPLLYCPMCGAKLKQP